mgnify:CR=1 FL=1
MSDLISRKAILGAIDKRERIMREAILFEINDDELRPTLNSIREFIKNRPAVDAELVRHGKWIKGGYACGEYEWKCSVCGETDWRGSADWMKFCMYCGAKMDLKEEEKE